MLNYQADLRPGSCGAEFSMETKICEVVLIAFAQKTEEEQKDHNVGITIIIQPPNYHKWVV